MVYSASAIVAADRFGDPVLLPQEAALLGRARHGAPLGRPCASTTGGSSGWWCRCSCCPSSCSCWSWCRRSARPSTARAAGSGSGPLSFQPVELAKFALVVYLAAFLAPARGRSCGASGTGLLPAPRWWPARMAGLTILQPDLGNSLALVLLTLALAYLAGARVLAHGGDRGCALPVVAAAHRAEAVPLAADGRVREPVGRPAGRRLPDHPVVPGAGLRGLARARARRVASRSSSTCPSPTPTSSSPSSARSSGSVGAVAVVALFALLSGAGCASGCARPDAFGGYLALGLTLCSPPRRW